MWKKIKENQVFMGYLYLFILAGIGMFLYSILSVIVYFLSACVLYIVAKPLIKFLHSIELPRNKRIPSAMVAALILGTIGGLSALLLLQVVPLIVTQSQKMNEILSVHLSQETMMIFLEDLNLWLDSKGIQIDTIDNFKDIVSKFDMSIIGEYFNGIIGALSSLGAWMFATVFISFFLLKQPHLLSDMMADNLSKKSSDKMREITHKIENILRRYLLGLMVQISLLIIYYWLLLIYFEVPHAFVIAFIAGLFNIIPYIGPVIGAILISFLGLTSLIGVEELNFVVHIGTIGKVLIGFCIIQLFDAMVSQPMIYSKSVKAHPLEVFMVILTVGILAGPIGMVLAIPSYTILRIIVKEIIYTYQTKQNEV